jgi:hypothetical protein
MPVAIKVVNVNGMPGISVRNAETFLNEVILLQRLRLESQHVVHIIDFDFNPSIGEGRFRDVFDRNQFLPFRLYCDGVRC